MKRPKINYKRGRGWPIFFKKRLSTGVGKTTLIRMLSQLINQPVIEFSVNNATDTSDLLGGFAKTEHFKNDSEFILDTIESIYIRLIEIKLEQKQNSLKTFESLMHLYLKFKFETINSSDDMLLSLLDKNLKQIIVLINYCG